MTLTTQMKQQIDSDLEWIWENRVADFTECQHRLIATQAKATRVHYELGILHALVLEAQLLVYQGMFQESIPKVKVAIEDYSSIQQDPYLPRAHNILAVAYMSISEFGEALQNYRTALSLCELFPDEELHAILLMNIAEMYRGALDENDKALPFFLEAIEITKKKPLRWTPLIYAATALCLIRLNRVAEAVPYIKELESLDVSALDPRIKIGIYQFLSQSYREMHEVDKAIDFIHSILPLFNEPQYKYILQNIHLILSQALQERGDSKEALIYCHMILENDGIDENSTLLLNLYKVMARAYKDLGNHEKEAHYLNLALEKSEKEITNRLERHTSLFIADMKYKTLEKDLEIHRLRNVELKEQAEILETTAAELQATLDDLLMTQEQLIKTEKMASLGELVAGVSHEINTPLGIGITIASFIENNLKDIQNQLLSEKLSKKFLISTIEETLEANNSLNVNLERAADIVNNFKQVAVDQSYFECRTFNVYEYIKDSLVMLEPFLKEYHYDIEIVCDQTLEIQSYPGALYQIISQLILNAVTHGFRDRTDGHIKIDVSSLHHHMCIRFSDNGQGILPEHQSKIFDPFYTTNKNKGNIGLGLHSLYNMIYQMLQGSITLVESSCEETIFEVRFKTGCRE